MNVYSKKISKGDKSRKYNVYIKKEKNPLEKTNYSPISILPTVSKIFEKMLFNQLQRFSRKFLSSLLCGIRKGYNTQHAL